MSGKSYNMYCPHCREWVGAKESYTEDFHRTRSGASKCVYHCPECGKQITPGPSWDRPPQTNLTPDQAKELLAQTSTPPDDIVINNKAWQLECTYLTRKEALESAEMMDTYRLFKYPQGYALYQRDYNL